MGRELCEVLNNCTVLVPRVIYPVVYKRQHDLPRLPLKDAGLDVHSSTLYTVNNHLKMHTEENYFNFVSGEELSN